MKQFIYTDISSLSNKTTKTAGNYPRRTKIVINNTILEQISHFQHLGCGIYFEEDKDNNKNNFFKEYVVQL